MQYEDMHETFTILFVQKKKKKKKEKRKTKKSYLAKIAIGNEE